MLWLLLKDIKLSLLKLTLSVILLWRRILLPLRLYLVYKIPYLYGMLHLFFFFDLDIITVRFPHHHKFTDILLKYYGMYWDWSDIYVIWFNNFELYIYYFIITFMVKKWIFLKNFYTKDLNRFYIKPYTYLLFVLNKKICFIEKNSFFIKTNYIHKDLYPWEKPKTYFKDNPKKPFRKRTLCLNYYLPISSHFVMYNVKNF